MIYCTERRKIPLNATSHDRRIAFVGLDKAGKTTTLVRLSRGILERTTPTVGFNTETFDFLGIKFNVFDLAGQSSYQIFWERFLPQQEAVVFFIDAADTRRIPQVRFALNKTLSLLKPDSTVMILANKQDLPNALTAADLFKTLDLSLSSKLKRLQIFPTSAITGMGIYDAFQWLISSLDIGIGEQQCTLYAFYVHLRNIKEPIFAGDSSSQKKKHLVNIEPLILQDSALITSLHTAIDNFTQDMTDGELVSFTFRTEHTGQSFKIVSVAQDDLICILLTAEGDSEVITATLGEAILKIFQEKRESRELIEPLDDPEIIGLIDMLTPFIRNAKDFKKTLETQSKFPASHILPEQKCTRIENNIRILEDFTQKKLNLTDDDEEKSGSRNFGSLGLSENQESVSSEKIKDTNHSTPVNIYMAQKSPLQQVFPIEKQDSTDLRPTKATLTPPEPSKQQEQVNKEETVIDENLFFKMGVAERIRYLQQRRKRLQED
ncbi:MAG: ADP-ribosylation factor family protein [Candidatus Hodarchaeota archaeon]